MRVKHAIFIFICLSMVSYANNNTSTLVDNVEVKQSKDIEIEHLKKRVETLELELAKYKKVKPHASTTLVSKKEIHKKEDFKGKKFILAAEAPKELSVYYSAAPQSISELRNKLESNGFTILAQDEILEAKTVISFTNESLKNTNSFLSVLHLLVNGEKEIRVQNPSYFAAAFLQEEYHYGDFNTTLQALQEVLGELYEVKERYQLTDLSEYHFMFGMPKVNDTILVAKGKNLKYKLHDENSSTYISYALDLPDGSILVGHKLQEKTYAYLKNVKAQNNALIFPYKVMLKEGRAFTLAPKYLLALSLPLLSMTDFLKIVSAPEEIVKDIKSAY